MSKIDKLVEALRAVEASPEIVGLQCNEFLTDSMSEHPLIAEVLLEADCSLITSTGGCAWAEHTALKQAGYAVTAGEKDSFGWLTGVIHTAKGLIVYG